MPYSLKGMRNENEGLQRHIAGDLAILIEDGIAVLVLKLKKRGFNDFPPDHPFSVTQLGL